MITAKNAVESMLNDMFCDHGETLGHCTGDHAGEGGAIDGIQLQTCEVVPGRQEEMGKSKLLSTTQLPC